MKAHQCVCINLCVVKMTTEFNEFSTTGCNSLGKVIILEVTPMLISRKNKWQTQLQHPELSRNAGASSAGWQSVVCGWVPQQQNFFFQSFPELGSACSMVWRWSGTAPQACLVLKPSELSRVILKFTLPRAEIHLNSGWFVLCSGKF